MWPDPAKLGPVSNWHALEHRAEELIRKARYGSRRRSPKWQTYRRRWREVRDVARRTTRQLDAVRAPEPVTFRDAVTSALLAGACVLAVPVALVAVPAVALFVAALVVNEKKT